jgi:hypothetical protein
LFEKYAVDKFEKISLFEKYAVDKFEKISLFEANITKSLAQTNTHLREVDMRLRTFQAQTEKSLSEFKTRTEKSLSELRASSDQADGYLVQLVRFEANHRETQKKTRDSLDTLRKAGRVLAKV